jgi:hypothetical protein
MKGEMKVAPALAASRAWAGAKQSVTLTVVAQPPAGFQAIPGQRHLDGDVRGDLGQMPALGDHAVRIRRRDLGTDRPVDDRANLLNRREEAAPGLCYKRRIGGDAVEQTGRRQVANLVNVGGIDEELHGAVFPRCLPDRGV